MSDLIGKNLGPYRITEQIGMGGMATVYKAYHAAMDRSVAVKVLPARMSDDVNFRKRFEREAKVVARLEHVHILPVYDYGEEDERLYLVMRYVRAGTLKERMAAGPMDLAEIKRIMKQVGSALAYAHRLKVIHRDIKPANVLVDAQGNCFLTDFGLAKMIGASSSMQLTATGVGMGTPAYMSPEQGQGEKVDSRSDIYSLGIMLYEMVTGRVPYEAETPMAVVFMHISDPLPPPSSIKPDVSPAVEQVILKALAKDPDDRYTTADELVAAFERALSQDKTSTFVPDKAAPPPSLPDTTLVSAATRASETPRMVEAPPRPKLPRGAFAMGAMVLLLALGAGVAIWFAAATGLFQPQEATTVVQVESTTPEKTNENAAVTASAIAEAEATAEAAASITAQAAAAAGIEAERTATAQAESAAAAISTAAAEVENQATTEAAATAAAEVEATSNALATAAAINTTATARTEANIKAATTTAQANTTATAQAARQATPTFTPAPPTATPTPTAPPTSTPLPSLSSPSIRGKLAFSLVQGPRYKVYVVEMQPTAPTTLYASIGDSRHPSLSPDGQYLLVDGTGGEFGGIMRYTSNGHQPTEATCRAITTESGRPAWSPDGKFLAFDGLGADPANPQIYIHKVDTPECDLVDKRFLVQGGPLIENSGLYPLWGLDDRIYFRGCATWIGQGGNCGVWSARSDGGDARKLHDNASYFPTSVGSNQLLTMSAESGNWEIYAIDLNRGQIANLTNYPTAADVWGALSPDGQTIAFLSNRGGPWAIWLMDANGRNPRAWMNINFDWGEVDPDKMAQDRMSWSK